MARQKKGTYTKATMQFTNKTMEELAFIGECMDEIERTRIVATSISCYSTLLKLLQEGKNILIKNKDGSLETIQFIN